jgi:Na+/H+ antiporter NhaC
MYTYTINEYIHTHRYVYIHTQIHKHIHTSTHPYINTSHKHSMSRDLHVGSFMSSSIGASIPPTLLVPASMFAAGLVSLSTGSSWGAMVLIFPIALPLAHSASFVHTDLSNNSSSVLASSNSSSSSSGSYIDYSSEASPLLINTIGAVISGSIFGDHVSPISDTTVLASLASSCTLVEHARTQVCMYVCL